MFVTVSSTPDHCKSCPRAVAMSSHLGKARLLLDPIAEGPRLGGAHLDAPLPAIAKDLEAAEALARDG